MEDLAKWDENFYTARVGGAAFIAAMLKPGVFNDGTPQNYASGLSIGQYKGRATVEHSGADAGYRANFLRFPEEHFSVIVLANLANINTGNRCRQVADLFLKPGKGEIYAVHIVDSAVMAKLTGEYLSMASKGRVNLADVHLRAVNDSVFINPDNGVEYRFHGSLLTLHAPGIQDRVFEKVKKITLLPAALQEYTGVFYSKELEVRYRVLVKDSALQLKMPRNEAMGLEPYIKDLFTGPFVVEFQRDRKGRVSGFLVTTGRTRNVRFVRDLEDSK